MISNLSTLIGEGVFEHRLLDTFDRLQKINRTRFPNHPDFIVDTDFGRFGLEAKCGQYGMRLKREQVENFELFDFPIFYILGDYSFPGISKRVSGMTKRGATRFLRKNISFRNLSLVDSRVISTLYYKQRVISEKGMEYCMLKSSHLNGMIGDKTISRSGETYLAREYYEVSTPSWRFERCDLNKTPNFDTFTSIYSCEHEPIVRFVDNQLQFPI